MSSFLLSCLALAGGEGAAPSGSIIEAESLYFEGGEYAQYEHASGGEYVDLLPGGEMMVEIDAQETLYDLKIQIMGAAEGSQLSVRIEGHDPVSYDLPASSVQGPYLISIRLPEIPIGLYSAWIEALGTNSSAVGLDYCMYEPAITCTGCALDDIDPPTFKAGKGQKVVLPVVNVPIYRDVVIVANALFGMVSTQSIKIHSFTVTNEVDGECSWQAPQTGGGPDECKQESPCKVTTTLKFTANNYIRWKVWDSHETVTFPDGTSEEFSRQGIPFTRSKSVELPCEDKEKEITWKFEKGGSATFKVKCNKCVW